MFVGKLRKAACFMIAALVFVAVGVLLTFWIRRPAFTAEEVASAVVTTIQREVPESFLVTGSMELTSMVSASHTRYLFPSILNLNLGTTEARVRCPGRVTYGFDIRDLDRDAVKVTDDGIVTVEVPPLAVFSVEPYLESVEIETSVGWARLYRESGVEQERLALRSLRQVLHEQAKHHLLTSDQPGIHTARALNVMLNPPLKAAGIDEPRIEVSIRGGITYRAERTIPDTK